MQKTPKPYLRLIMPALALSSLLHAQSTDNQQPAPADKPVVTPPVASTPTPAPSTKDEEVIVLSPFVVSSDDNVGYVATSSLGGGRLKTDFRDIASQVNVMTPEFLADINAFDLDEAYLYSTNTENAAEVAGTETQFFGGGGTGVVGNNRTRGIGGATVSQNFFTTNIPTSFYNTGDGGLTIASGPNAILFGLGSAGGLSDSRLNSADLRKTKGQLKFNADSFGSMRGSIDYNQPIIKNKLGLRIDALNSDKKFFTKPSYEKDKRLYGALKFEPTKRITMEIKAETMDRKTDRPVLFLPRDGVTAWTNPNIGNRTPFNSPDLSPLAVATLATNPASNAYLNNWDVNTENSRAPTYTTGGGLTPGVYFYRFTAEPRLIGDTLDEGYGSTSLAGNPVFFQAGLPTAMNFHNEQNFPFMSYSPYGLTHPAEAKAKALKSINTVKLADRLFMEVAANWETYEDRAFNLLNTNAALKIDPTAYLYKEGYIPQNPTATGTAGTTARADNAANRVDNPALGSLYIGGNAQKIEVKRKIREFRTSLAYDFQPTKNINASWAQLINNQRFFTNVSFSDTQFKRQEYRRRILDTGIDPVTGRGIAPSVITATNSKDPGPTFTGTPRYLVTDNRFFNLRSYFNPDDPSNRYATLGGLDPWAPWVFNDTLGSPYTVDFVPEFAASGNRTQDFSRAFSWQGYFLKKRLVLTYAKRWDTVSAKDVLVTTADNRTGLFPDYSIVPWQRFERLPTFKNDTKSAVLHVFNWLSTHYNESTNNEAAAPTNHDITGRLYPVSSGKGKDYGFTLFYKNLSLRINRFSNFATSTDAGNDLGAARGGPQDMEARYINLQRNRVNALGLAPFDDYYLKTDTQDGFNPADNTRAYYRIFADNVARGTEFQLTGTVGKIDLRLTVSKQTSVKSNVGRGFLDYITDPVVIARMEQLEYYSLDTSGNYRPVIADSGTALTFGNIGDTPLKGWDKIRYANGNAQTIRERWLRTYLPTSLTAAQFEGIDNPKIRPWRANLTLGYNYGKGLRFGTSVRMRDRAVIAYYNQLIPVVDPSGAPVLNTDGSQLLSPAGDLSRPVFNEREYYYDPFIKYTRKLKTGNKLTVQFNISNLLGNDDFIPVNASASDLNRVPVSDPRYSYYGWTDQTLLPNSYTIQEPRSYSMTVTLDF